ncbi:MAG: hypothetical protein K6T86_03100 [Pirellulales bacterium]|nr:hypothetical protein [Pirellulales bacterium]
MSSPASPPSGSSVTPTGAPNQAVRTTVTFLLFLHLCALAIGVASRNASPSPLAFQLRAVPGIRPYLQMLAMDLSYQYQISYYQPARVGPPALLEAAPEDTDHFFELELGRGDGPPLQVRLPPRGMQPPLRRKRYQRLAVNTALLVEDDTLAGLIPRAVAARLVHETGADSGRIACRRVYPRPMDAWQSNNPQDLDPYGSAYLRTVVEYDLIVQPGQVEVLKRESAQDVAPASQEP